MHVVPAGVHHAVHLGVDGPVGVLLHGQPVDVAPHHDRPARPAAVHGEDPTRLGSPDGLVDAQRLHAVADHPRRDVLLQRQLRAAVQGAAHVDHVVEDGVPGDRSEQVAHRRTLTAALKVQRPSRSRAMCVTWISSVPA